MKKIFCWVPVSINSVTDLVFGGVDERFFDFSCAFRMRNGPSTKFPVKKINTKIMKPLLLRTSQGLYRLMKLLIKYPKNYADYGIRDNPPAC